MIFCPKMHRAAVAFVAAAAVVNTSPAQQTGGRPADASRAATPSAKDAPRGERASGVILKVEPLTKDGGAAGKRREGSAEGRNRPAFRLTINTNTVWRDWARDQARFVDKGPASKDAARGANSIATQGEPVDRNNTVVVDVGPDTRVETRFRAADDETSKGAKTPQAAREGGAPRDSRTRTAKPVEFRVQDLRAGLFVEVDYRPVNAKSAASSVAVIRPIGGPDAPAGAGVRPRGDSPR
jgi:hypothetical protein